MKRFLTIAALVLTCAFTAGADEGMWMVNAINKALEKNMIKLIFVCLEEIM